MMKREDQHDKKSSVSPLGVALGLGLGVVFGAAMRNIGVGLCFGVSFAMLLNMALTRK